MRFIRILFLVLLLALTSACAPMNVTAYVDDDDFVDIRARQPAVGQATATEQPLRFAQIELAGELSYRYDTVQMTSSYRLESREIVAAPVYRRQLLQQLAQAGHALEGGSHTLWVRLIGAERKARSWNHVGEIMVTQVRYTVVGPVGQLLYDKTMVAEYNAQDLPSRPFLPATRRRQALSASCLVNIEGFIQDLGRSDLEAGQRVGRPAAAHLSQRVNELVYRKLNPLESVGAVAVAALTALFIVLGTLAM